MEILLNTAMSGPRKPPASTCADAGLLVEQEKLKEFWHLLGLTTQLWNINTYKRVMFVLLFSAFMT